MTKNPLIENFLEKIRAEDGLSANTVLSYGKDLELVNKFLIEQDLSFQKATIGDIKDYFYQLYQENLRSASIARKVSCLKNFYKFLENEKIVSSNPAIRLETPKKDVKLPKFLSEEEVFKLLDFISQDESEFGIKLSCMFEILYSAGLRVTELVSLPISAIQEITDENGERTLRNHLIVTGKGGKERIAALNKSAIRVLLKYLDFRKKMGQEESKWLFVGSVRSSKVKNRQDSSEEKIKNSKKDAQISKYKHITRQRFHQMLKELAQRAGVDVNKIHPHVIRHSFATHLLNSGVDLRILQELLGHSDISTTEIYTHILDSKLKDLVFSHHPLSKR